MPAELTTDVNRAAELLRAGGLVAFSTETVYGLGGNALNEQAVARIFAAKQRPWFDPLIVHLADAEDISTVVAEVPLQAKQLISTFWPGPLTLVLPRNPVIPDLVTAGLPNVAVRVPDHPLARELIRRSGVPIAAPSANPFGRISPTTAGHVLKYLASEIDLILDGGPCRIGVESTVLQIEPGTSPLLLRPGGLTREAIEAEIGPIRFPQGHGIESEPQTAPGRLLKHYAPRKKLILLSEEVSFPRTSTTGVLSLLPVSHPEKFGHVEILSASGDLSEATARFFGALRQLDECDAVQIIYARRFPPYGLGTALNDRLERAAR